MGEVYQLIVIPLFPKGFAFQVSLLFLISTKAQSHGCLMNPDFFSLKVEVGSFHTPCLEVYLS